MVSPTANNHHYVFDDVYLDFENFSVHKDGEIRPLTPRAFDVLVYLVENGGRVVEKQELFDNVWHEKFVSDNALTRAVKEVRHAIGDRAESPRYIETIHKRGYRFIATVHLADPQPYTASDAIPQYDKPTPSGTPEAIPTHRVANNTKYWLLPGLAIAAIAITVLVVILPKRNQEKPPPAKPIIAHNMQITTWTGLDIFPTLSPDGNSVAYSSDHDGSFEIYVRQLTPGSKENRLTSDGQENFQPNWSPDGKLIAFYSRDRGGIWLIPASGGTARQLTEFGSRPTWSRDGSHIAFQSGGLEDVSSSSTIAPTSTIWMISIQGGDPVQITKPGNPIGGHGSPALSPDGKRIVFCANDIWDSVIWQVTVDGQKLWRMTPEKHTYYDPIYTPDGKSILMVAGGVWRVSVAETGNALGEPEQIGSRGPAMIRNLTLSSDGKRAAYSLVRQTGNLWSVPLKNSIDTAGVPAPFVEDTSQRKTTPFFSPDGSKVAYAAWIAGTAGSVWTADADGGNRAQSTTDPSTIVGWMNASELAVVSYISDKSLLISLRPDSGRKKPLAEVSLPLSFPRLSTDGQQIAFNFYSGGSMNLWLYSVMDGSTRQLTFDQESLGFPTWSPDGRWIAAELKRKEDTYLVLVPVAGGETVQLNSDRGQSWPGSWSPDGDKIVFAACRKGVWNIRWISRTTKQQKRLTNYVKPNSFVRYPTWSPRGDKIVYEYAELNGNIWLAELAGDTWTW